MPPLQIAIAALKSDADEGIQSNCERADGLRQESGASDWSEALGGGRLQNSRHWKVPTGGSSEPWFSLKFVGGTIFIDPLDEIRQISRI